MDVDMTHIGSTVLVEPFFLPRELRIQPPTDWSSNLTRGKSYESTVGEGRLLWDRVQVALAAMRSSPGSVRESPVAAYGDPVLVRPRLGQGAFRVMVTDA